MPHTETYYVSVKDNQVRPITSNSTSYFTPNGKNYGKAKYIISIFAFCNHRKLANQIKKMIGDNYLSDKIFTISVDWRSDS